MATLNTNQVIDNLMRCAAGQIVACNVLAGVEHRLVDPAWVKETLAWMGRLGAHADYATPEKLVDALRDLRGGKVSEDVDIQDGPPDIRLRGEVPRPFQVDVTCVVPRHVLDRILWPEDRLRLRREGLEPQSSEAGFLAASAISEWRSKPASARTARFDPTKSLGRPVAWFTRRDAFAQSTAGLNANDCTRNVRDKLGLIHHKAGTMLAALHFPRDALSGIPSARPTFADAADHRRFKTWPDGAAARKRRRWGTTVDLQALNANATSVDGWPERVTKEIGGAALGEGRFEFELLGCVPALQGTVPATDAAFATRLAGGRSTADIAQQLKAL